MHKFEAIVIGSGPSSVICAQKLVEKKINTLMVDYGLEIDENKKKLIKELSKLKKNEWNSFYRNKLYGDKNYRDNNLPIKLSFGSSFPYDNSSNKLKINTKNIETYPSLAKGGLSNVWGGSVLPYREEDFKSWPINLNDLKDYYSYVANKINISTFKNDLENHFPIYASNVLFLDNSKQSKILSKKFLKNNNILNREGIFIGNSRLAVNQNKLECLQCGSCLYGCVYSLIYNSGDELENLKKNKYFEYKKDLIVEKFIEEKDSVIIICKNKNNEIIKLISDRIYIGAGYLSTAKIVLNSYNVNFEKKRTTANDSQYFFFPALMFSSSKKILSENLHTLSQFFLEIKNKNISKHMSHLQIYTFNDLFEKFIKNKLSFFYPLIKKMLEKFLYGRIIFIQGYLHSDISSLATIKIQDYNNVNHLEVNKVENYTSKNYIKKILNLLKKNSKNLGFFPLSIFLKIGNYGSGYHSGGTFKMSNENDKIGKSDKWGRPFGFKKIHLIDSSILPSIPSTTITFTIMANAARIADNHNKYES